MRFPHVSLIATFFAYFSKVRMSHIFTHKLAFLTTILILFLLLFRKEVVREDCQACKLNKEDAVDRCKWRKVIKEVR